MTDGSALQLPPLRTPDGRAPRLLHAGGSRSRAIVLSVLAANLGCEPVFCENGTALIAALCTRPADLVIVDGELPDMTAETLAVLAGDVPGQDDVPVIVTGGDALADVGPALARPFSPRDLHRALGTALRSAHRYAPSYGGDVRSRLSAALNSAPKISATATT